MPYSPPKELQSDQQLMDAQFTFKGAWQPDFDPARIGPENFKLLQNMRYIDGGLEGVLGYSKINTTALTTYVKIWNGFHLRSNFSQTSYVLVHAVNTATGQGRVYENRTSIPDQGDFEDGASDHLHADASVNLLGRFSGAPGGAVSYCNGEENYIYHGDEARVAGFFRCTDATFADPEDFTEEMNNTLTDSDETVTLEVGTKPFWLIFTTRPITEVNYTIETPNNAASTMTGFYFDGTDFTSALGNLSDGTASGGISMAQTGQVTFDAQSDAKPYHFQGLYLYAYYFTIDAGINCEVSHVTVKAPWQKQVDVWDGVYRQPIQAQMYNDSTAATEDYTLQVNESSSLQVPIGMDISQSQSADKMYFMFEDRMSAIRFTMLSSKINKAAGVITVKYWNGSSYTACANPVDGTLDSGGTKSWNQSGLLSWAPPDRESEKKQTAYGTTGYMYEVTHTGTLTGTEANNDVVIDVVTGIPAQLKVRPFKFSVLYKGRLMRGNYVPGKEGNRLDYTTKDAADVWNGFDSSQDGIQSLYFGGQDDLTGAIQLYNRFGSNIYAVLLVVKPTETYILNGDSPEDYKIYPVSLKVGCPAPLTLDSAEVGFTLAEDIERNVAMWCSYSGPVMFDGAVLKPIQGIDIYFDPNSDNPVNTDAIANARGWVDSTYQEYNLLLPVGAGQTTCNKWFVYDLRRKKWYEKELATASPVQCGIPVYDDYGVQYTYGGLLTGYMMRLENGASWDGTNIDQKVQTGDFWPSDNIWHQTRIRYIMLVAERVDEDADVSVYHFADTDVTGTDQVSFTDMSGGVSWADHPDETPVWGETSSISINLQASGQSERLARDSRPIDKLAWAHGFSFEISTASVPRAFRPIAWAIRWGYERHDQTWE